VKGDEYEAKLRQEQFVLRHTVYLNIKAILEHSRMGWRYEYDDIEYRKYSFKVDHIPLFEHRRKGISFCHVDWKRGWLLAQVSQMLEFMPEDKVLEMVLDEEGSLLGFSYKSFPGLMKLPWVGWMKSMLRRDRILNREIPWNVELIFTGIPSPVDWPAELLYYGARVEDEFLL
jgi:hypothetical protein